MWGDKKFFSVNWRKNKINRDNKYLKEDSSFRKSKALDISAS
jgi:hypothetical protein